MPFTQDTTTTQTGKNTCAGCSERCELDAVLYISECFAGFQGTRAVYYWPTIGGKIIKSYKASDGATVRNTHRAKTSLEATRLARDISKLCTNYKTKQDNQR